MKKNHLILLFVMLCVFGRSSAQQVRPCYTDEVRKQLIAAHPEILQTEADLETQIKNALQKIDYSKVARTTSADETNNPDFWYDIPVVVHIIHNYGAEDLTDDDVFNDLAGWNIVYAKENSDTSNVIAPYAGFINNSRVRYIGNPHIRLHLATIDPNGNPTKGITRHLSYLTFTAGENAKFDDWPPSSYVNIWSVNTIPASGGFTAAAYAFQPAGAASDPIGDGILCDYDYMPNSPYSSGEIGKTINHEMGHVFNLSHPWGNNNFPQVAEGDDNVDDTPPTWGHNPIGCDMGPSSDDNSVYDTMFATNFFVLYTSASGGDSLVNYPDTTNAQNIMDYTYCSRMFTNGQVARMHAALNSNIAGRNNLWDSLNLVYTGALVPRPDLKPIPDFFPTSSNSLPAMGSYMSLVSYFNFPKNTVFFHNETWNDTVDNLTWTFSNTASTPSVTYSSTATVSTVVSNSFTDPGWINLTMKAHGNNNIGDTSVTWNHAVFVANTTGTPGIGYYQEFGGADTAQWPMFNYYNNDFKWQMANVGYDDNNSVEYVGYDSRSYPISATGSPNGDFDDLFSIPMDLSGYVSGDCSLSYYFSGASRSSTSVDINDELDIDYSVDKSTTWISLAKLTKGQIDNKGAISTPYAPQSGSDWSQMSLNIPAAARTNYVVFRFRYKPNVDVNGNSSGNNFYMDRINFSQWPASVNNVQLGNMDVAVAPNPTGGDAYVIVKDADNTTAKVVVTDITGKVVYTTSMQVTNNEAHILIPHAAISVAGMYIVQTITGNQVQTRKLVVE